MREELLRQENLERIYEESLSKLSKHATPTRAIDTDWTLEFIECSQNTSDTTLQDIWASILSGEMEEPGKTSKRTLNMVRGLSTSEAKAIQQAMNRLCKVHFPENEIKQYINVFISNRWHVIASKPDRWENPPLLDDSLENEEMLIDCGFLNPKDYIFEISTNHDTQKPELLDKCPTKFEFGNQIIELEKSQLSFIKDNAPDILENILGGQSHKYMKFDGWELTFAGKDLVKTLSPSTDPDHFDRFVSALNRGGLAFQIKRQE